MWHNPVMRSSTAWLMLGLVVLIVGAFAVWWITGAAQL